MTPARAPENPLKIYPISVLVNCPKPDDPPWKTEKWKRRMR
jgi:hypothetical protein